MTEFIIFKKTFLPPAVNKKEIFRYAGCPTTEKATEKIICDCLVEAEGKISYQVCWCQLPLSVNGNEIALGDLKFNSKNLSKNLNGCKTAVVFAATLGLQIDRLISKYSKISPSKSVIMQAIGTERIEALCDAFEEHLLNKLNDNNLFLRPRFSPGYGDLDLSLQKEILNLLNSSKQIGLTLNNSLLMSPSKSVTAIIGIGNKSEAKCNIKSCRNCNLTDCEFRRSV